MKYLALLFLLACGSEPQSAALCTWTDATGASLSSVSMKQGGSFTLTALCSADATFSGVSFRGYTTSGDGSGISSTFAPSELSPLPANAVVTVTASGTATNTIYNLCSTPTGVMAKHQADEVCATLTVWVNP